MPDDASRPNHTLDISVGNGGEIKVNVQFKEAVPNLIGRYAEEVQRRAHRWFWIMNRHERKVWRATKDMPPWARETVRQHLLQQRAELIQHNLAKRAAKRQQREDARVAKMTAKAKVAEPPMPLRAIVPPMERQATGGTAWTPTRPAQPTLTQQFAQRRPTPVAQPRPPTTQQRNR